MTTSIHHRKPRCDAKLLHLPEEKRRLIAEWLSLEGIGACLQHIEKEWGISTTYNSVYLALARWNADEMYAQYIADARAQVEVEARAKDLTPEQIEEAIDRKFIVLASVKQNPKLYSQLRFLRIADQKAKNQKRLADAKLQHGVKVLRQKDKALELAERKVVLLEKKIDEAKQATENKTLSAEERARRVREILQ